MLEMHLFDAPSYDALTPDMPTLCGRWTVAEMDYDPRTEAGPETPCSACMKLAPSAVFYDAAARMLHWWESDPITGDLFSACGVKVQAGPAPINHVEPDTKCLACVARVGWNPS